MNKTEVLGAFLLANIPEIITQEEFDDVKKAIKELQQENQQLKNQLKEKHDGFMASVDESCEFAEENQKYKETIDKAIKYIKANEFYLDYSTGACIKGVMPLLNILNEVDE